MSQFFRPAQPEKTPAEGLGWAWTDIQGPDARDFLHRLTTVDVKSLQPGGEARGFFLNPQGRIECSFLLACMAPDHFAFEYESGEGGRERARLTEWIERFHFAEKFSLAHSG